MNLIQIQEHLKDLPTQAIMAYANGQNPQVPPYMALGEMNRRKNMEQRAAQAPDSSVKEKLEGELAQQLALPGVGQGMNMRMNPAGMPEPMPAVQPQMAPPMQKMQNPPMARPMPPQQMSRPGSIPAGAPGMAGGGLATLPVDSDMFSYAPGGIVAFAEGDLVELPEGLANTIMREQLEGKVGLPMPVSREDERKRFARENPELGAMLNKIPGEALAALAAKLEEQNQSQRDRFQEGEGRQGLAALSNALIAAGEATRGQKGFGGLGAAFGGFGKAYNTSTAEAEQRAARQQAMERAQTIETMKLQSDIEQMQRAFAEGRFEDGMKHKAAIEAREGKIQEIKGARAKDVLSLGDTRRQRAEQERHNKAVEENQRQQQAIAAERAKYERENRPTVEDKNILSVMSRLNADPDYRAMLKKRDNFNPGDPEFEAIQDVLDSMRDAAFADLKLTAPTKRQRLKSTAPPEDTRSFLDKLSGKPAPGNFPSLPPGFVPVK
jgi:hypothetical protein